MAINCKNCNNLYDGNYCNHCGQSANTHEINFKSILHEVQHSLLHIDKGILYTTKELLLRPGKTISDYLNGKRVKHFKPFAYIFILSTIYAILTKLSHKAIFLNSFIKGIIAGLTDGNAKNDFEVAVKTAQWMTNNYAYTTLLIIPIFSFASYLCFYKAKYNYFQHLILNSFIAGFRTVVFLILLPFTYFITNKNINEIIDVGKVFLGLILTIWAYFQFFNNTKPFLRVLLTLFTYFIMFVILTFLIILSAIIF
jgi:hypothetical protein